MEPVRVLVTGVGGGGHGEQIVKALRLARTPYHVVGADVSPYSKGLAEVDQAYLVPPASDAEYIPTLVRLCEKQRIRALFHGSEPELRAMNVGRRQIEEAGIFLPLNPASVIDLCMDKVKTCDFLASHGFTAPVSRRIRSIGDLDTFDPLPAVLKPSIGGGGSANVFLGQTRQELRAFGQYLLSVYPEFIVQEYVGTPDSEFTVGILLGMDGLLLNSIAVRRNIMSALSNRITVLNRTARQELGAQLAISNGISQGEIGRFPEVTETCERIAVAMGARGPINLQCRYADGKVYIFEVNPRFSGTTSLRALVGYNEPDVLIRRHLFNEAIEPHFTYESRVIVRGLSEIALQSCQVPDARSV